MHLIFISRIEFDASADETNAWYSDPSEYSISGNVVTFSSSDSARAYGYAARTMCNSINDQNLAVVPATWTGNSGSYEVGTCEFTDLDPNNALIDTSVTQESCSWVEAGWDSVHWLNRCAHETKSPQARAFFCVNSITKAFDARTRRSFSA